MVDRKIPNISKPFCYHDELEISEVIKARLTYHLIEIKSDTYFDNMQKFKIFLYSLAMTAMMWKVYLVVLVSVAIVITEASKGTRYTTVSREFKIYNAASSTTRLNFIPTMRAGQFYTVIDV